MPQPHLVIGPHVLVVREDADALLHGTQITGPDLPATMHGKIESRIAKSPAARSDRQAPVVTGARLQEYLGITVGKGKDHLHTRAIEPRYSRDGVAPRVEDVLRGPKRTKPAGVEQLARGGMHQLLTKPRCPQRAQAGSFHQPSGRSPFWGS